MIDDLENFLDNLEVPVYKNEKHKEKLRKTLQLRIDELEKKPSISGTFRNSRQILIAAACLMILFSVFITSYFFFSSPLQGTVSAFRGTISVLKDKKIMKTKIDKNYKIKPGDKIITEKNSRVSFSINKKTRISLDAETILHFINFTKSTNNIEILTYLVKGKTNFHIEFPDQNVSFKVDTDFLTISVIGTDFTVDIDPETEVRIELNSGSMEIRKKYVIPAIGKSLQKIDPDLFQKTILAFEDQNKTVLNSIASFSMNKEELENLNLKLTEQLTQIYNKVVGEQNDSQTEEQQHIPRTTETPSNKEKSNYNNNDLHSSLTPDSNKITDTRRHAIVEEPVQELVFAYNMGDLLLDEIIENLKQDLQALNSRKITMISVSIDNLTNPVFESGNIILFVNREKVSTTTIKNLRELINISGAILQQPYQKEIIENRITILFSGTDETVLHNLVIESSDIFLGDIQAFLESM